MSNQRFSITPATAATDLDMPDSVFRTLAVIGIYGDRNGWCWPSQSLLAKQRGVSRQTINNHVKTLIQFGYLNIYHDYDEITGAQKTNQMQIRFDRDYTPVKPGLDTPCQDNDLTPPVKPGLDTNAPINAQSERIKKEKEPQNIFQCYEQVIGTISQPLVDDLEMYDEEFDFEWIKDAFKVAAEKNARNWRYVKKILDNWKANGKDWYPGKKEEVKPRKERREKAKIVNPTTGEIEEVIIT